MSRSNGSRGEALIPDGELYTGEIREFYLGGAGEQRLGVWEFARFVGVEKSRIARWLAEGDSVIPRPVTRLKCGPLWTVEQAQEKLGQLYRDAGCPNGDNAEGLEKWARARRARRAKLDRGPVKPRKVKAAKKKARSKRAVAA